MNKMKKAELVFIPFPVTGHLVSMVEVARLLVDRDDRLSVTVLIIKLPSDNTVATYTQSLTSSNLSSRIKFIDLPDYQPDKESTPPKNFFTYLIESKKPHVKEVVSKLTDDSPDSPQLAGFVLDMFCTCMIEVADEFKVPSYIFFTSGAAFLSFMLRVQALHDEEDIVLTELKDSDAVLEVPGLVNSVPAKVWPSSVFDKEWVEALYQQARSFRGVKGILVNTFEELESCAVRSFCDGKTKSPPLYAVGPILNIKGVNYDFGEGGAEKKADVMTWLDDQPESSVVFLCFGSRGTFGEDQVKEIARALEQSGHRFLWSMRRPPSKDKFEKPSDYEDPTDVLPEGFMDRTADIGKVIGWAPQAAVLAHPAIGGFVSHCGWNSTLESIWFGVPIATWPMNAEQQFNAFGLVVELGLAVEIKMDYRKEDFVIENPTTVVSAQEIERGIRCLMEHNSEMRTRVKEMSEKARKALLDGGSSFSSVGRLVDDFLDNIA